MNILAFDTAAAACSAVLVHDGETAAHEWQAMARGHAEALMPMIERVMRGHDYDRLAAIGVTVGPGAYTGLRIGIATARGLALATGVPVVGITSFAVAVQQVAPSLPAAVDLLVVALETKRADIYLQAFDPAGTAVTQPQSVPTDAVPAWLPEGAKRLVVAGDAVDRLVAALPERLETVVAQGATLPDAAAVAALVAARLSGGDVAADEPPVRPLYLRPPDATPPKVRRRGDG